MSNILFYERQYFRVWWVWLILLMPFSILLVGLIYQFVYDKPFGTNSMSNTNLTIVAVSYLALLILMVFCRMETKMSCEFIAIRYFPFVPIYLKFYRNDISRIEAVTYDPISDALGWGIRFSSKWGLVYSIKGNEGISIELKNGKKYLIGTSETQNFENAIQLWKIES